MKKLILLLLLSIFSSTLFAQEWNWGRIINKPIYWSDRDNLYPNGFVSAFAIQDDYIYSLLDTGNTGISKIFKARKSKYLSKFDTIVNDDVMQWQLYFGGPDKYFLREQKLCFITSQGHVRIVLLQRNNEKCSPRIIDITPEGVILSDNLLPIELGLDVLIQKIDDESFITAFTPKYDNVYNSVRLLSFDLNGSVIKSSELTDSNTYIDLTNFQRKENGEIMLVTGVNTTNCYWNLKMHYIDKDFNVQSVFTDDTLFVIDNKAAIGKRLDDSWIVEFLFKRAQDTLDIEVPKMYNNIVKTLNIYKDSIIDITHSDRYPHDQWRNYKFVSEPFPDGILHCYSVKRFGYAPVCNFNTLRRDVYLTLNGKNRSYSSHYSTYQALETSVGYTLTNVYELDKTHLYGSVIYEDSSVYILEIEITLPPYLSVDDKVSNETKPSACEIYTGETAIINIPKIEEYIAYLQIFDSMGNRLDIKGYSATGNELRISTTNLQSGVYFYLIPQLNIRGKFGVMK